MIKKVIIIAAASLVVLGGLAYGGYYGYTRLISGYETRVQDAETITAEYRSLYGEVHETMTAYAAAESFQYGTEVTEEDFYEIIVPDSIAGGLITDPGELPGKYYRVNVSAGTLLTHDLIMDFPQSDDERAFDVIVSFSAIGLEINDFIDIRINLPLGEDYVAISHKRVIGLYGNVIKVVMSEYDITVYNSLVVDAALFDGTIYATKYLEPGSQAAAQAFYPIAPNVLRAALDDPNIPEFIDYQTILERREKLEDAIAAFSDDITLRQLLRQSKSSIPQIIKAGDGEYRTQKELEYQRALEEAIIQGGT